MVHKAVLQKEVLEYLNPKPNENFIDCTIGEGGHAVAVLKENGPRGKILGIETDPDLYEKLRAAEIKKQKSKIKNRLILVNDSYVNLKKIVKKNNFGPVHGILLDLGISSWHLEKSGRGFSFLRNEPLDMRYDITTFQRSKNYYRLTAAEIVNTWPESEIEKILKEYGEEKFSRRIAKKIAEARKIKPIKTTFQLVEIIRKAIPRKYPKTRIHFATRTFQALRITVNDELNNLKKVLPQTVEVLATGGRIVVISFHSLEDRIVKKFFKNLSTATFQEKITNKQIPQKVVGGESPGKLKILTKKPITPSQEEIKINPRSRSSKLRAAIKI